MSDVDMNKQDLLHDEVLQHGTSDLQNTDQVLSEQTDQ